MNERLELIGRVLKQDYVQTDAQPERPKNYLAKTFGNLLRATMSGYNATLRVLPDEYVDRVVDYTYLGREGSLGWNVPPWAEKNRGKTVIETFSHKRQGRVEYR
jgi:hypothetical protein